MPLLAHRNLLYDKARFAVTLAGIVFAIVLVVIQLGLFIGFTVSTSAVIDRSGADFWVAAKVSNTSRLLTRSPNASSTSPSVFRT